MFNGVKVIVAKSAGTSAQAPMQLSIQLIRWADRIFCMEDHHQAAVLELDPEAQPKIQVLNIPDLYMHAEPKLKKLLSKKISFLLAND